MNIIHCLPTLGSQGYGVTSVVKGLIDRQIQHSHSVIASTLDSPFPISKVSSSSVDVIHQHMIWLPHGHHAHAISRRSSSPLLVTPHGALDPWSLRKSRWKKKIAIMLGEYRRLNSATCLQATSPFEVKYFRELGFTNPIALIPNGVSAGDFSCNISIHSNSLLCDYPHLSSKRCLLFLSRITPQKGLHLLLHAFASVIFSYPNSDWHLIIAGSDQNGYLSEVFHLIDSLSLVDHVTIMPPVYGDSKNQLFSFCEAFVLPSLAEGFPMVVLEAMASGLPVIATTASPWEELLSTNSGWWVSPSVSALSSAISDLVSSDSSQLCKMGSRAKALVCSNYDIDLVVIRLQHLYRWMISGNDLPPFVTL